MRSRVSAFALVMCSIGAGMCEAASVSGRVTTAEGKPIVDAVVFLQAGSEDEEALNRRAAKRAAKMDQVDKAFVPGLLPVVVGTQVSFPNHDQIQHHVYSFSRTKTFELPLYKGTDAPPVLFDKVGVVKVGCNIHDWMSGIILVLPSEAFARTDAQGRFTIENLPAGTHTLMAWHELSKQKPEDTAQTVDTAASVADLSFTLTLGTARARPAMRGSRRDP